MEDCGISLWAKVMCGDVTVTECTHQINRKKIMLSFVNMISRNVKHFINFPNIEN